MMVMQLLSKDHGATGQQGISRRTMVHAMTFSDSGSVASRKITKVICFDRTLLERSGKDFTIMKVLPSGVYQYRFIVDGQWKYLPDMPWIHDEAGNPCNILDLQVFFCIVQKLSIFQIL